MDLNGLALPQLVVDLTQMPPPPPQRTQAVVNAIFARWVRHMNLVSNVCDRRLTAVDERINRLDANLLLLEDKLLSIPALAQLRANDLAARPFTEQLSTSSAASDNGEVITSAGPPLASHISEDLSKSNVPSSKAPTINQLESMQSEAQPAVRPVPADPQMQRFLNMVKFGVPVSAVKQQMLIEGCDPNELQRFLTQQK